MSSPSDVGSCGVGPHPVPGQGVAVDLLEVPLEAALGKQFPALGAAGAFFVEPLSALEQKRWYKIHTTCH